VVRAIEVAAKYLGNTPTICRKSYVHPEVIDAYLNGALLKAVEQQDENAVQDALHGLRPEEVAVLSFLQH
jgi:DNA topoisomerase-1